MKPPLSHVTQGMLPFCYMVVQERIILKLPMTGIKKHNKTHRVSFNIKIKITEN